MYLALDRRGGEEPAASNAVGSSLDYHAAAAVVSASHRIIVGTYIDARTDEIDLISPVTGEVYGSRTDVIWRFEVIETLKGRIPPDEFQEVENTSEVDIPAHDVMPATAWQQEVFSLDAGREFVLFLVEGSDQDGSKPWGLAGIPGVAALDEAGDLEFLVTDEYVEHAQAVGLISGDDRVPFTATLDEIRTEIARQAAAPTPATPAPEPTPAKTIPQNP
jgi:hypothetical protein